MQILLILIIFLGEHFIAASPFAPPDFTCPTSFSPGDWLRGSKRRCRSLDEASLYSTLQSSVNSCLHFMVQTLPSEALGHSLAPWVASRTV